MFAYIFLPKCGGCSVCEYLQELDDWDIPAKNPVCSSDTNIIIPPHYKIFTVVREPVSWVLSGYRMFKQRRNYNLSITEHLELLRNPHNVFTHYRDTRNDWADWWWHCGITPDKHFEKYSNVQVFKLNELHKLQNYLGPYFNTKDIVFPHTNQTEPEDIELTNYDRKLINEITYFYNLKFINW
jgi:hypothetical protein